jgi:hypothetical protein
LGPHTRRADLNKLTSLHYKLLRIATNDWRSKTSRKELDLLGRVKPSVWSKYATSNLVIKALRDKVPVRLVSHLEKTRFCERRAPDLIKFYDGSHLKTGFQAIGNRIGRIFDEIKTPFTLNESNDVIRTRMKKACNFNT